MKTTILQLIRFYQKYLSLDTGFARSLIPPTLPVSGRVCRHFPTCSEYTHQAVEKHGIVTGLVLGIRRVLRCHPWASEEPALSSAKKK
ncbi:membrane protein insertion efficiency factor YidD [Candidatus Woesebacteria bacterium]|nr:membrane protein insertion efficiency factor YidD [Candidatus Woesebacteria bacterium]|tara:strand:+ start:434 stop:697 length:264 start_codon:yes stop_codon:yes gene_type:complete